MISSSHELIVVTPVYEDLEASSRLFRELVSLYGEKVFIVAVDDGSVRQPLPVAALESAAASGVVLKLRRNVGHQRAIAVGLGFVAEHMGAHQVVVVLDSDGEDRPDTIQQLMQQLASQSVDVVVAQRKSRVETLRFKAFYLVYKAFFWMMTGRAISFGNFMALRSHAVHRLVSMQETPIHVAGAVLASKLRTGGCPIDRGARYAGQSKMNMVGLVLHGFKALMVFAEDVLVRVGMACALIAAACVTGAVAATFLKIIGYSTPGWFSIALGVLVLMFLQTGALALMTLMLTGVMRGGMVMSGFGHRDFIDTVLESTHNQRPVDKPGAKHPRMNALTQERLRYVVNGVLATLVHFAVLEICLGALGLRSAGLANAIGAMAGIATSFVGSRLFVFAAGRDKPVSGQFARFLLLYGCIAVFHAVFLLVWSDLGGLNHRLGFLIATVFQVLGSYFGNRLWVFK